MENIFGELADKLKEVDNQLNKKFQIFTSRAMSVYDLHKITFNKYKNCHNGKNIVLLATGPSLNKYTPFDNVINVGVNRSFMFDKVKLDYLFIQDYIASKNYIKQANLYQGNNVKKFYGILFEEIIPECIIPESDVIDAKAERYYVNTPEIPYRFTRDIATSPFGDAFSVVFPAMQFILWTNPKKIYLVGCDCAGTNYFCGNEQTVMALDNLSNGWQEMKKFVNRHYPDTEIISVNPIGLKGIFNDLYTE
jgi:hypothetical protein